MNSELFEVVKVVKGYSNEVVSITVVDKKYRETKVSFKWDGCIDYREYQNGFKVEDEVVGDESNSYYIHICDVNEMIEKLQEIKRIAEMSFEEDNVNEYWR